MKSISRRTFLNTAGALSLYLSPLVQTMRLQAASLPPKRLFIFFSPLGTMKDAWLPTGSGSNFALSEILSPLNSFKSDLIVSKGLKQTRSSMAGNHKEVGGLLTGMACDGENEKSKHSNISLDQLLANMPQNSSQPFKSIELAAWHNSYGKKIETDHSYLSALGAGQAVIPEGLPDKAFARIFGGFSAPNTSGGGSTPVNSGNAKKRSLLSGITEELKIIRSSGLSGVEHQKIDQHLTAVEEVEKRLIDLPTSSSECAPPNKPGVYGFNDDNTLNTRFRLQLDIAIQALACGRTNIVTVTGEGGRSDAKHPWLGIDAGFHDVSHGDKTSNPGEKHTKISKWYAEEFKHVLSSLKSIKEGNGTLLDNTCVLWLSEQGCRENKNDTHSRENMPWVIAGQCGGAFKTGRYVDLSGYETNNFLITVMNAMGKSGNSIGKMSTNPLSL